MSEDEVAEKLWQRSLALLRIAKLVGVYDPNRPDSLDLEVVVEAVRLLSDRAREADERVRAAAEAARVDSLVEAAPVVDAAPPSGTTPRGCDEGCASRRGYSTCDCGAEAEPGSAAPAEACTPRWVEWGVHALLVRGSEVLADITENIGGDVEWHVDGTGAGTALGLEQGRRIVEAVIAAEGALP